VNSFLKRILRKLGEKKLPASEKIGKDEFLKWLSFAVPGMTGGGNVECIRYAIKNLPTSSPIIEIGSFCGLSTILISHFKTKFGKTNQIYTCDKWEFEGQESGASLGGNQNITHDEYKKFVKDSYIRNIETFYGADLPATIEVFSDEFFDLWNKKEEAVDVLGRNVKLGGRISFAFIDGNHTYEFAKRDFINADNLLEKGGFILLDDSSDYSHWAGVNKLAKEVLKESRYELVARNPNYFLRKK